MAVTMLIGNQSPNTPSGISFSLFDSGYTMSSALANKFNEAIPGLNTSALVEIGLVLFGVTIIVNIFARLLVFYTAKDVQGGSNHERDAASPTSLRRHAQAAMSPGASSTNAVMLTLVLLAAGLAILVLGLVLFFLLSKGFSSLHLTPVHAPAEQYQHRSRAAWRSPSSGRWCCSAWRPCIGLPLGILGGIYQVEARGKFASHGALLHRRSERHPVHRHRHLRLCRRRLPDRAARIPAPGFSAYAGGFALGILMIPTVMRTTEEILRLVPFSMREASLGLGATRWRTMWSVVLPAARGGVITGIMLALARIAGETAPLLFTILGNEYFSHPPVLGGQLSHPDAECADRCAAAADL